MKDKTKKAVIFFTVDPELKEVLKAAAKTETEKRGAKVKMTTLFCEWVNSLKQSA